jgi:hypothetical protein
MSDLTTPSLSPRSPNCYTRAGMAEEPEPGIFRAANAKVSLRGYGPGGALPAAHGSFLTRRWREMDSNPRSPVKHQLEVVLRALDQGPRLD